MSHQRRRAFSVVLFRSSVTLRVEQSASATEVYRDARTSPSPRVPRATQGALTGRPYLPSPGARHQRPQTSNAFRSSFYAGNWDPMLRETRDCIKKSIERFPQYIRKTTFPQSAMLEMVLGSDDAKAVGPALRTSKKVSCIVSA